MTTALDAKTSFNASWTAASFEEDLRRWSDFLGANGVSWSPDPRTRDFVKQLAETGSPSAGDGIAMRLGKLADDALAAAGDARRVVKLVATGARYVLSPEERRALETEGHRFTSSNDALRTLATIPVTLGAYFATQWICTQAGLDRNIAWVVAIVVYVGTVRIVRGRWPYQRA